MRVRLRDVLFGCACLAALASAPVGPAQAWAQDPATPQLTREQLVSRTEALERTIDATRTRLADLKADDTLTSKQAEVYEAVLTQQSEKLKGVRESAARSEPPPDLAALDALLKEAEAALAAQAGELDALAANKVWHDTLNALPSRIEKLEGLVNGLVGRVAQVKGSNTISGKQADQYTAVLSAQAEQLKAAKQTATQLEGRSQRASAEQGDLAEDLARLDQQLVAVESTIRSLTAQLGDLAADKGWSLVDKLLAARCATAICFANGESQYWLGIEPLVELPVGISSALGNTGLAEYINNHELSIDLAAGLRVWLFDDMVSISLYLSKPLIESSVRVEGSSFVYPGTAVRRSFPGFALGLFFDSIWIGFDRNELRNGDSDNPMAFNPDFAPNVVVSSAWTITVALQPVTAFRTALGTANEVAKED